MVKFRVISIFLVFALICNMIPLRVFAKPEGNPLFESINSPVRKEILKEFDLLCRDAHSRAVKYTITSRYRNDHREIRVYSMPYLALDQVDGDTSLIYEYGIMLFDGRKAQVEAKEKAAAVLGVTTNVMKQILETGEQLSKVKPIYRGEKEEEKRKRVLEEVKIAYYSALCKRLGEEGTIGNKALVQVAKKLGVGLCELLDSFASITDPTVAETALFTTSGITFAGAAASTGVLIAVKTGAIAASSAAVVAPPIALSALAVAGIGTAIVGALKVNEKHRLEEIRNISWVLRIIFSEMISTDCSWRNQNLFITAIDHRKRCGEDHGSWAGFMNLYGLTQAPTVRLGDDIDRKMLLNSRIYRALTLPDGEINLDKLYALCERKPTMGNALLPQPLIQPVIDVRTLPQADRADSLRQLQEYGLALPRSDRERQMQEYVRTLSPADRAALLRQLQETDNEDQQPR